MFHVALIVLFTLSLVSTHVVQQRLVQVSREHNGVLRARADETVALEYPRGPDLAHDAGEQRRVLPGVGHQGDDLVLAPPRRGRVVLALVEQVVEQAVLLLRLRVADQGQEGELCASDDELDGGPDGDRWEWVEDLLDTCTLLSDETQGKIEQEGERGVREG